MPLYDFRCESGHVFERQVPLKYFEEVQHCTCQAPSVRVISTPRFSVDQTDYTCPVTDKWIGSKREHEENLKRTGCRVLESGEKELAAKFRRAEEAKFDKAIEDTVEREFEVMPSAKKEKLANELLSGVDVAVERK